MVKQTLSSEIYAKKVKYYDLMISNLEKQLECTKNDKFEDLLQFQNAWLELRLSIESVDALISTEEGKGISLGDSHIVQDLMVKGERLSELNLAIQRIMEKRLADVKEELAQIKIGQKVANGYRVFTKSTSAFLDKNI